MDTWKLHQAKMLYTPVYMFNCWLNVGRYILKGLRGLIEQFTLEISVDSWRYYYGTQITYNLLPIFSCADDNNWNTEHKKENIFWKVHWNPNMAIYCFKIPWYDQRLISIRFDSVMKNIQMAMKDIFNSDMYSNSLNWNKIPLFGKHFRFFNPF